MFDIINPIFSSFWNRFTDVIPDFFGGLLILITGLIVAGILKKILLTLFSFFRLEALLQKTRLMEKKEVMLWEEVFAEIVRWTAVILFLIPTLEVWRPTRATSVISQFLFYIPNIIVAVVIGFVGLIVSNLVSDVVRNSIKTTGATSANTLAIFAKWLTVFFTVLIVINQLGVAQDLVRILFTGIVVMIALAGGLAFGLGGRDMAREMLEEMRKKVK